MAGVSLQSEGGGWRRTFSIKIQSISIIAPKKQTIDIVSQRIYINAKSNKIRKLQVQIAFSLQMPFPTVI